MKNNIIHKYDEDVIKFGGYLYTVSPKLSSQIANKRLTEASLEMLSLANKKVLDIGCGDGTYTYELFKGGKPRLILGVDLSKEAIFMAKKKFKKIRFQLGDIYKLAFKKGSYDIAIIRGVLHHLAYPQKAIKEALFVAKTVLIIEPNGYNPFVKLIENISEYHISHQETSYYPFIIRKWISNSGAKITKEKFVNFVPFFCPNFIAIIFKKLEPLIENFPIVNKFLCAAYVIKIKNND